MTLGVSSQSEPYHWFGQTVPRHPLGRCGSREIEEITLGRGDRLRGRPRPACPPRRLCAAPRSGPARRARRRPRPPPSIIAGPPMPMLESSVAITTSQHPSSAALPAKQYPAAIPTSGTRPLRRREKIKRAAVEARHHRHVDIPRSSPASLREQHHRQPAALGDLEQPVLLLVAAHALGAGEHHVVIGHRYAAPAVGPRRHPPTRPSAGVRSDQLLARAAALLGGEQQRAVLDERTLVHELCEVLPGRGGRAGDVWRQPRDARRRADVVALAYGPEIRALAAVDWARWVRGAIPPPSASGLERQQQLALRREHRPPPPRGGRATPAVSLIGPRAPSSSPRHHRASMPAPTRASAEWEFEPADPGERGCHRLLDR